jgi:hypothetical protein
MLFAVADGPPPQWVRVVEGLKEPLLPLFVDQFPVFAALFVVEDVREDGVTLLHEKLPVGFRHTLGTSDVRHWMWREQHLDIKGGVRGG